MNTILLLEDDESINRGIAFTLEKDGYQVYSCKTVTEAERIFHQKEIELLLCDITLPDGNGLDFVKRVRSESGVHIIFLTALDQEIDQVMGYEAGADDYMTKPFSPSELVARVKSQLRRYTQLGSTAEHAGQEVYEAGGLAINDDLKEVTVDGEPVKLTPIEYNILLLLVKNQGKVFSIDQIYESIWNEDAIGVDNTVAVHIRHIREKIEINPKEPRYLKVVWGVGYKVEKF